VSGLLVEFSGAGVSFADERVLAGFTAEIRAGDSIAMLGPSGSGKTTLLKAIAGRQAVTEGTARLHFDADKPGQFGYVSQSNSLLPWLTVSENVAFPLKIMKDAANAPARVRAILREVGLEGHGRKYPREISGGMARRVVLARTLVYEPQFLLLDEPFAGLDAATRYRLIDLLLELRAKHGFTQICVEHHVEAAIKLATAFWVFGGPGRPVAILNTVDALRAELARS
jgi:NitT/TauT family transport system ATP-binding protein